MQKDMVDQFQQAMMKMFQSSVRSRKANRAIRQELDHLQNLTNS